MPVKSAIFKFTRSATFRRTFTYKTGGVPVDLTGSKVVFHLLKNGSLVDVMTLTSGEAATENGSALTITDAVAGAFELELSVAETTALSFDEGSWWLALVSNVGRVRPIGRGSARVVNPGNG